MSSQKPPYRSECTSGCSSRIGPITLSGILDELRVVVVEAHASRSLDSTFPHDAPANLAELDVAAAGAEDDLVTVGEEALARARARAAIPPSRGSGPEIAPVAIRSPVRTAAPFEVACASCCGIVQ